MPLRYFVDDHDKWVKYYLENPYDYFEDHLRIRTKDGDLVPFRPNKAQRFLGDKVFADFKAGKPIRYVVLKGRQMGMSTIIQAILYWATALLPGFNTLVMAHDNKASQNLLRMTKRFNDNREFPDYKTIKENKQEIIFEITESSYLCKSVASPSGTRSYTIHGAHLSEVAFWEENCPRPEETFNAIKKSVPNSARTMMFAESTAKGFGFYKELFDLGRTDADSEWTSIFLPWFWFDEYQKEIPTTFRLTGGEEKYKKMFDLTDEQIYWRRCEIKGVPNGKQMFKQEFPSIPEEAFLMSGNGLFDIEMLNKIKNNIMDKEVPYHDLSIDGQLNEVPYETNMRVYKQPHKGKSYFMGVDVALGKGKDYSCIVIVDEHGYQQLCYSSNRIEPHELAKMVVELGNIYNYAQVAIESNSMGIYVIKKTLEMDYLNHFYNPKWDGEQYYATSEQGFRTTVKSKNMAISNLIESVFEEPRIIQDMTTLSEMFTYITKGTKMQADSSRHDDHVMATAIALMAWKISVENSCIHVSLENMSILRDSPRDIKLSKNSIIRDTKRKENEGQVAKPYLSPIFHK